MPKPERHVLVCRFAREGGSRPCCASRGSPEVYAAFVEAVARHDDLAARVLVTDTGCLGPCFDGPNVVVYPDGVWYAGVTAADVPTIVTEHLVKNRPVPRLLANPDPDLDSDLDLD
ncbi:MAG TPA: (2Fe-2S) ferredoxin domain-containing protein [Kofleriaceae bacterium]|nr:(2Fe-2S) ferredoxin domain-containing protein [Kofleriaceae bacterium]